MPFRNSKSLVLKSESCGSLIPWALKMARRAVSGQTVA
jgi:hypothetical protein